MAGIGGIVVLFLINFSAEQNWGLALAASALYAAASLALGAFLRTPRCAKVDGARTASDVLIMLGVFGVGLSLYFIPTNLINCDVTIYEVFDCKQRRRVVILLTTSLPALALSLWIAVKWRVASMTVAVFVSCCIVISDVDEVLHMGRAVAFTNVFSALWLAGGAVCHILNRVLTPRELKWACAIGGVAYFTTMHILLGIPSSHHFLSFSSPSLGTWLLYDLICMVPLGVLGVLVNGNALLLLLAAFGIVMHVYFTLDALLVMVGIQQTWGTLFMLPHFVVLTATGLSLVGAGFLYQRHAAQIQAAVDQCAQRSCRHFRPERTYLAVEMEEASVEAVGLLDVDEVDEVDVDALDVDEQV